MRLYLRSSVHEPPEDIVALQELLDRSYDGAGRHLRSITTPERRVNAEELVELLTGMCLLVVATGTAPGGARSSRSRCMGGRFPSMSTRPRRGASARRCSRSTGRALATRTGSVSS